MSELEEKLLSLENSQFARLCPGYAMFARFLLAISEILS